jgi:catechol 2,3-dioxygenase-like lactoylglutathione lyase family enzyme
MQALQIFHINVNCSDLERSLEFYKRIGFSEVIDFNAQTESADSGGAALGEPQLGPALGLPAGTPARARMLMLGDNPRSARLDLIEWQDTDRTTPPYDSLTRLGIARICLRVRDIDEAYREMLAANARPFTEPTLIDMGGSRQKFFCAYDPDGTVVEFMEFLRD